MANHIAIILPQLAVATGLPSYLWIDGSLPFLEINVSAIVTDHDVNLHLPSLDVAIHVLTSNSGSIAITLGWPQMASPLEVNFQTGGQIAITLPSLGMPDSSTSNINVLTSTLINIAAVLPKPSMTMESASEGIGWIDVELPGLTGTTHVISANHGHIAGAIPLPKFIGRSKTGGTGDIDIDLPFLTYDSVLLPGGMVDISITLPCFITTATGSSEPATISYRTIIMNTMNFGVTEYGALELKGMTDVFGKVIAINRNDLVHVGSTLDDTEHINAVMQTGTLDFSDKFFTKPRDIWITLRSGKKILLTMKDNEVPANETTYDSEEFVESLHKTRVKVGRGFNSEFFDIKIENVDGELVDISDIHVYSELLRGKKR